MAVRDALLVLLMNGPAYGFQLHGDLAARTGGRRVVNVGQTYATLERLTSQGLVEPAGSTDDGLPLHRLADAGRVAADAWLGGADGAGTDAWHESVDRVLISVSMPAIDARPVIEAEIARWRERREAADASASPVTPAHGGDPGPRARLGAAAATAEVARADAMLAWLDGLAASDLDGSAFAPSTERPKRGRRPSRGSAVAAVATNGQAPADA